LNSVYSIISVLDDTVKLILATRLIINLLILALIVYLICKFLDLCKTVNELSKRNKEQAELLKQQNETLVKIGQIMIKINKDKEE
jgi:large-conductance mechanosensitive channel